MPFCSFCKKQYEIPRGMTLVMTDCTIHHFCSSKCRKNFLLKRRKCKWVLKNPENKAILKQKEENKKARAEATKREAELKKEKKTSKK